MIHNPFGIFFSTICVQIAWIDNVAIIHCTLQTKNCIQYVPSVMCESEIACLNSYVFNFDIIQNTNWCKRIHIFDINAQNAAVILYIQINNSNHDDREKVNKMNKKGLLSDNLPHSGHSIHIVISMQRIFVYFRMCAVFPHRFLHCPPFITSGSFVIFFFSPPIFSVLRFPLELSFII